MTYQIKINKEKKTCQKQHRQGVSSYKMHDPELVFRHLCIKKGSIVIDLGCGAGDYSFHSAESTGERGLVYPCDKWPELKEKLEKRAEESNFKNIIPKQFDLTADTFPFEENYADLCLLATVLHIPIIKKYSEHIFSQIKRILKPSGVLAIINCKKEEMPFGPPLQMRLSPEDTQSLLAQSGFLKVKEVVDLGYNYMTLFQYKQ